MTPRMWRCEPTEGGEVYRAEVAIRGERWALVVFPVHAHAGPDGRMWAAHVGSWRWASMDVAMRGDCLTFEPTAELARKAAQGWADSV